jgi:hypothetical protein
MSARKLSEKEKKQSKINKYRRLTTAVVFAVAGRTSEQLREFIESLYALHPYGDFVRKQDKGYLITEPGYIPDKTEDPIVRIVEPNQIWAIDYGKEICKELFSNDLHFEWDKKTISRKHLLEAKVLEH